jgi:hypothetical protein
VRHRGHPRTSCNFATDLTAWFRQESDDNWTLFLDGPYVRRGVSCRWDTRVGGRDYGSPRNRILTAARARKAVGFDANLGTAYGCDKSRFYGVRVRSGPVHSVVLKLGRTERPGRTLWFSQRVPASWGEIIASMDILTCRLESGPARIGRMGARGHTRVMLRRPGHFSDPNAEQ